MQIDSLRVLDRFVGIPLCFICTLARRLGRLFYSHSTADSPRKILIIKLSEMGSTVLAYPALAEIRSRCPGAEIFFLVFKNNAAIVEALDLIPRTNIIPIDYGSPVLLLRTGFAAVRLLLSERIDTVIDMDFFSRLTALLSFLVCRGNRVGFYRYHDEGLYRGDLLTHRVLYSAHVHTSVAFMALALSLFDAPDDEPHYRGWIDPAALVPAAYKPMPADLESVRRKLADAGARSSGTSIILINPNSSDIFPLRKWPIDNFAHLCANLLTSVPDCRLVVTGVSREKEDARRILEYVADPRCIDFTGRTTFRELLALYSMARLMITSDSGPAHFATLLDLPTIVLFGPETPLLYSPLGEKTKIIYTALACSPCVSVHNGKKSSCTDNQCLKSISVEMVLREALHELGDHLEAPKVLAR
jgi:ADP-heptose:LPS heptosyltransferase